MKEKIKEFAKKHPYAVKTVIFVTGFAVGCIIGNLKKCDGVYQSGWKIGYKAGAIDGTEYAINNCLDVGYEIEPDVIMPGAYDLLDKYGISRD